MYSALAMPPFRSVKLRSRRVSCLACGIEGEKVGSIEATDYVAFCGGERPDWVSRGLVNGSPDIRIRAKVGLTRYVFLRTRLVNIVLRVGYEGAFITRWPKATTTGRPTPNGIRDMPSPGVYQ